MNDKNLNETYDVAIIGGGLVGASLACALSPLGLKTVLVEAVAFKAASQPSYDDRTLALSASSCRILQGLGVWPRVEQSATAIREIHVRELNRPGRVIMRPEELGLDRFGHVVEARVFGQAMLETLPALARGWPVARTSGALQRFEVADDKFQRRLEYYSAGEAAGTIFLGTSPGFRKVHTRPGDADAVYAVDFNTFDAPVGETDWLDKTLLQLTDVTAITGVDYEIRLEEGQWQAAGEQAPEQSQVDALVNGLSGLRVTGAADIATAAVLNDLDAPATLTVTSGDATRELRLYEIEDAYYIGRDDIPVYFSLSAYDHDRLNDVNAASLFPPVEEADTGEPEATTVAEPTDAPGSDT